MGFDYKDILSMLEAGEDVDTLADNFTKALNTAIQKQKEKDNKDKDTAELLLMIQTYTEKYYPELLGDKKMDVEAFYKSMEFISKLSDSLAGLGDMLTDIVPEEEETDGDAADAIDEFLKKMNW